MHNNRTIEESSCIMLSDVFTNMSINETIEFDIDQINQGNGLEYNNEK